MARDALVPDARWCVLVLDDELDARPGFGRSTGGEEAWYYEDTLLGSKWERLG